VSRLIPCKRRDFIRKLQKLGFEGMFSGTRHQFMIYNQCRLTIPSNPEYSVPQLKMMLREVASILNREITIDEWNDLR
jgi:predicted RNA binding protein YcfA (HicA-like mRNA interferase family)